MLWHQADECLVLAALTEAEAKTPGALHSVRQVRQATELPKERFDGAALRLERRREVVLHYHDYPGGLSPGERAALIHDPRGVYYVGIAVPTR